MQVNVTTTQLTATVAPTRLTARIGSSGDVLGPGSATDGQAALFDGPSGRRLRPTATGAVGLSLLARSTLTAGSLLLGAGAGAPTELATSSYGRSLLGLADAAAGRNALELGPTHSPTFAGLTSTDTIWATNGVIQTIVSYGGSTGNIGTNSSHALALITAGSERVNISTGGVTTFYGTAPGTPGAGEVRIGDGKLWSAGNLISYGSILCTPPNSHANLVLGANDSGSYGTVTYNGNGSQQNWRVGCNITVAGAFEFIPSTAVGGATFTTPVLTIAHTGTATFNGDIRAAIGGAALSLLPGSVDHSYMQFYPRTSTPGARGGYFGFAAAGSSNIQLAVEIGYLSFLSSYATGTAGANEVRVGAGKLNAASDIETATGFYVAGSLQPVSAVSLVNVNASSTYDLLTVGDNEMWQLDIGNATDGYMVHTVFGKPSASVGAVIAANNNTHANLTVALVGNVLRISNGVGATRTMIYVLTRLR